MTAFGFWFSFQSLYSVICWIVFSVRRRWIGKSKIVSRPIMNLNSCKLFRWVLVSFFSFFRVIHSSLSAKCLLQFSYVYVSTEFFFPLSVDDLYFLNAIISNFLLSFREFRMSFWLFFLRFARRISTQNRFSPKIILIVYIATESFPFVFYLTISTANIFFGWTRKATKII